VFSERLTRSSTRRSLSGSVTARTDVPYPDCASCGTAAWLWIISDVERISDRHVRLRAGTLYAALDRLEGEELVEFDREEVVQGRLRRYYKLTAAGAECLSAEIHRLRRHANAASRRLRAGGSPVYRLADERRYR
jgi:hypothetical protein